MDLRRKLNFRSGPPLCPSKASALRPSARNLRTENGTFTFDSNSHVSSQAASFVASGLLNEDKRLRDKVSRHLTLLKHFPHG